MLKVDFFHLKDIPDEKFKFAVIMARTSCGWLFVRHNDRQTWEIPGGHREAGELIRETAARELYEETGATASILVPVCVYSVDTGGMKTYGILFFAEVESIAALPESEIAEVQLCDKMPDNLTYPDIQPLLFNAGIEYAISWDYTMSEVF